MNNINFSVNHLDLNIQKEQIIQPQQLVPLEVVLVKKTTVGSANNYSKRSSSRGKSPPLVSASISNVASNPASNANKNVNSISSSAANQQLPNSSSPGTTQKMVSTNQSGAVQINSSSA